jgi:hypothetical protein
MIHSSIQRRTATPRAAFLLCLAAIVLAGCGQAVDERHPGDEASSQGLRPGLHAMMTELQLRHANLWFAGDAENWPLAEHQVHELEELLEKTAEYHPEYSGVRVGELLTAMTDTSVAALDAAVDARDAAAFRTAFDGLTERCNACHTVAERGYLVIQRPRVPPLDNLRYAPEAP